MIFYVRKNRLVFISNQKGIKIQNFDFGEYNTI